MNVTRFRSLLTCMGLATAFAWPGAGSAQQGTIAGRVTDQASGQPLAGARVGVVGTTLLTQTNADGRYVLARVPAGQVTVRASSIGYGAVSRSVTLTAGETATADLALAQQAFSLDEVVVTATGEQARKELGHAVATIRADSMVQRAPIANIADLLVGKVAGVQVLPGNITGAESRVRIRGTNSLSLNNEPVYYIDGIRMESDNGSSSIGIGGTNPSRLQDLNPEEIESIEVVRGPSAATLYGTDAANGVVVIKTKRGRAGAPQWNIYSELGILRDQNDWPIAYRGWRTGATTGTNSTPFNTVQCLLSDQAQGICVQDSVTTFNLFDDQDASPLGTGWRGQLGAQVSGGSDAARYFVSGEYEDEIGVLRMPDFAWNRVTTGRQISQVPYEQFRPNARKKVSVRANLQATLNPKLDVAVNSGFISSDGRLPQTDNNTTGLLSNGFGGPGNKDTVRYGYRLFTPDQFFSETVRQEINRFIGSGTLNYRPNAWLSGRAVAGIDFTSRVDSDLCRKDECTSFVIDLGPLTDGFKEENRTTFHNYTLDANMSAAYSLTSTLRGRLTAGVQYFQDAFRRNGAFGFRIPPGATTVSPASILDADESDNETKTLGVFVEQLFTMNERLYVTGALRVDDNSAFGRDFSAVYYPKFSTSWVVSDEKFFPALSWLSQLRVRGAIGTSGQQPGSTDAIRFFEPTSSRSENLDKPAIVLSQIGNDSLKPERAAEVELGFDAQLFNNRASFEFTFYHKRTKDALIARPVPPSLGGPTDQFENLGAVRNSGIEAVFNALVVRTPAFGWDLNLAASYNSNEIEDMGGVAPIVGTTIHQRQGYPVDSYFLRPILGYTDINGNGFIEGHEIFVGDSVQFIGPNVPTTEVTLATGVDFLNGRLRISGLLDYKGGKYQLHGTDRIRCESRLNCDGLIDPNSPTWKQIRVVALKDHSSRTQWGFVENADFVRLRELAVTYTVPTGWARAIRAQGATLTVAGRNLALFTKYSGMDPESGYLDGGLQTDFQTQPPPTYWTARMNITF